MQGRYEARPISWGLTKSSTGKDRAEVVFQLVNEPVRRTWYGYFASEQNSEMTMKALETMGWDGVSLRNLKLNPDVTVEIVIEEEEYTDNRGEKKRQDKVQWVNPLRTVVSMPLDDIAALEARVLKNRAPKPAEPEAFEDPFA